jgi:hypothetical protein
MLLLDEILVIQKKQSSEGKASDPSSSPPEYVLVDGRVFHDASPSNFKECCVFLDPPGLLSQGAEIPFGLRTSFSLQESIGSSQWWPLLITKAKGAKLYGMVCTLSSTAHPRSQATTGGLGLGGNKYPFHFVLLSRVPHFSLMQTLLRAMAVRWLVSTQEHRQEEGEFEYLAPLVKDVDPLTLSLRPSTCTCVCVCASVLCV